MANDNFENWWSYWTILGMEYSASQEIWDDVLAKGRPVVAHIAQSQAHYNTAVSKGASMVQCAGTMQILPVSEPL